MKKKSIVIPVAVLLIAVIAGSLIDVFAPGWLLNHEYLTLAFVAVLSIIGAWAIYTDKETKE